MSNIVDKIIKTLTSSKLITFFFVMILYFTLHTNIDKFSFLSDDLINIVFKNKNYLSFVNMFLLNTILFGFAFVIFLHGLWELLYKYDDDENRIPSLALKNACVLENIIYYCFIVKLILHSLFMYKLSPGEFFYTFFDGLSLIHLNALFGFVPYVLSLIKENPKKLVAVLLLLILLFASINSN